MVSIDLSHWCLKYFYGGVDLTLLDIIEKDSLLLFSSEQVSPNRDKNLLKILILCLKKI